MGLASTLVPVGELAGSTLWGLYWLPLRWLEQAGLEGLWALAVIWVAATVTPGVAARGHWRAARAAHAGTHAMTRRPRGAP